MVHMGAIRDALFPLAVQNGFDITIDFINDRLLFRRLGKTEDVFTISRPEVSFGYWKRLAVSRVEFWRIRNVEVSALSDDGTN